MCCLLTAAGHGHGHGHGPSRGGAGAAARALRALVPTGLAELAPSRWELGPPWAAARATFLFDPFLTPRSLCFVGGCVLGSLKQSIVSFHLKTRADLHTESEGKYFAPLIKLPFGSRRVFCPPLSKVLYVLRTARGCERDPVALRSPLFEGQVCGSLRGQVPSSPRAAGRGGVPRHPWTRVLWTGVNMATHLTWVAQNRALPLGKI